jgi:hypothetical protein
MIRELVACEHEYINTDHPDFIGGTRAVKVRQQNVYGTWCYGIMASVSVVMVLPVSQQTTPDFIWRHVGSTGEEHYDLHVTI